MRHFAVLSNNGTVSLYRKSQNSQYNILLIFTDSCAIWVPSKSWAGGRALASEAKGGGFIL